MKRLTVVTLLVLFGISSAKAVVNCGPVPDPCNPTKTFSWTCNDGQTCGTAFCGSVCSAWAGFNCVGNTGYIQVTAPVGPCNNPQG